jgi:hypothetical protein
MKSIYPTKKRPYYITTPRYVRTSAGIRALHLLCHWLNRMGEEAYVHISPSWDFDCTCRGFLTPILTEAIVEHHCCEGRDPIVIYSETETENILQAKNVVRFFGHLPGHLGNFNVISDRELYFSYSSSIAKATNSPQNILFIPTIDTSIFFQPSNSQVRSGTCFYAAKYQTVHKQKVFGLPDGCFEIKRDTPGQLNQNELAALFRRSELLYCFEDSAIANEAALCGCPVVLMPNPFFARPIAIEEVGWDGYAWGNSEVEINRARDTVFKVARRYQVLINEFFEQLDRFVFITQNYFSASNSERAAVWPKSVFSASRGQEEPVFEGGGFRSLMTALVYAMPFLGVRLKDRARLYKENILLKEQLEKNR